MLGKLDALVQRFISAASNRGSVITRSVVTSTARALLNRYPDVVGEIAVKDTFWAKSLLQRMRMVHRMKTISKLPIPEGAIREAGLLSHHDIVSKLKRHKILDALVLDLDQTPSKYVIVAQTTLAKENSKSVVIAGGYDKRSITAIFTVSFDRTFLLVQLIYGGKMTQSLPIFKFPSSFSLSVNPTHYSNENEACKMIEEIIAPYVKNVWERNKLPVDQKAFPTMDVFLEQMTQAILYTL